MVLLWHCCENASLERKFFRVYSLKQHQGFIEEVCGRHCDRCIYLTCIHYVLHWVFCSKWARSVFKKKWNHFKIRKHTTVCICHVWACMVTRGGQRQITSLHKSRPLMSNWHQWGTARGLTDSEIRSHYIFRAHNISDCAHLSAAVHL